MKKEGQALLQEMWRKIPHNMALGIELGVVADGQAHMVLPYKEELVGDPDTGVIHGGVITALMDACCGAAVFSRLSKPVPFATLDLRIDYFKPAVPRQALVAHAECTKLTSQVAFTRCTAYQGDEGAPIASATATFMLSTAGGS